MPDPFLVTGCGSGIGYAVCEHLVADGHAVVGMDISGTAPDGVDVVRVDLAQHDDLQRALHQVPDQLAGVANVAGLPGSHPAAKVLAVNFLAVRAITEAAASRLGAGSAVVDVSSVAAHRSPRTADEVDAVLGAEGWDEAARVLAGLDLDGPAAYDFSKKVVNELAIRSAARLIGPRVRCLTVSPGPVETPILDDFTTTMGASSMQASVDVVGRHGTADEVAAVVAFALSPAAAWLNAVDLRVDGGLLGIRSVLKRQAA